MEKLLTLKEAKKLTGVTTRTIIHWNKEGVKGIKQLISG